MGRDKTILADMGSGRRHVTARAKQVPEKEKLAMGTRDAGRCHQPKQEYIIKDPM